MGVRTLGSVLRDNDQLFDECRKLTDERATLKARVAELDKLKATLRRSCEEHLRVAAWYERDGNTAGAMQLRAVANLIGVILQGGTPTTVLRAT